MSMCESINLAMFGWLSFRKMFVSLTIACLWTLDSGLATLIAAKVFSAGSNPSLTLERDFCKYSIQW